MEAMAKRGSKSLVSLGMGVKPRHGANVVLGCTTVVEHDLDHDVHDLRLISRFLLIAVHELDIRFTLLSR